jgi:hypothetical protein
MMVKVKSRVDNETPLVTRGKAGRKEVAVQLMKRGKVVPSDERTDECGRGVYAIVPVGADEADDTTVDGVTRRWWLTI